MVLTEKIIGYKMPERVLLAGRSFLELYRKERGKAGILNSHDSGLVNSENIKNLFRSTGNGDVGVVLSGDKFIYNILEFEKLPVRSSQKNEMVEWRLGKVFPGDLSEYDHRVITLGRKTILSVLLPLTIKADLSHSFSEADLKEIYIGNSFIEMCNLCRKSGKSSLTIELGDDYCVVGFGQPLLYVRKFTSPDLNGVINELDRTTAHIKKKMLKDDISEVYVLDSSCGNASAVAEYFSREHKLKTSVTSRSEFAGGLK